jgi:hypothetical protein
MSANARHHDKNDLPSHDIFVDTTPTHSLMIVRHVQICSADAEHHQLLQVVVRCGQDPLLLHRRAHVQDPPAGRGQRRHRASQRPGRLAHLEKSAPALRTCRPARICSTWHGETCKPSDAYRIHHYFETSAFLDWYNLLLFVL